MCDAKTIFPDDLFTSPVFMIFQRKTTLLMWNVEKRIESNSKRIGRHSSVTSSKEYAKYAYCVIFF